MRKPRMVPCLFLLACLAPVGAPAQQAEQEEMAPPTMVLSRFQCDWSRIGDIIAELELSVPVWEELVSEGKLAAAGSYVHAWADEWNVGTYLVAPGIAEAVAANAEVNERLAERHPDATVFADACPRHRDAFYEMGPVADNEGAPTGGTPALVLSMYQCDSDRIEEVFSQAVDFAIPVYEEMIQEGKLRGAGSFRHSWADEWNVGFYWIAEDAQTFLGGWDEANQRIGERAGADAPNALAEACPIHKDAMYTLGPRTGGGGASGN